MNKNLEKYNKIFIDLLDVQESELPVLKLKESPNWDSVGHIGLISNLEDTFDISLDVDDMFALTSYQEGLQILKKYNIVF
jgi:acyl carrier protein